MGTLCLRRSPITIEIGVLLLDDVGLLLRQEHPASLLLHVVAPSVLVLQRPLRLALHRRHLHTHQILLLRQALPEAIVKVMLACSVACRRRRQEASSITRLGGLIPVHLLLRGEIRRLVRRVQVALRLDVWRNRRSFLLHLHALRLVVVASSRVLDQGGWRRGGRVCAIVADGVEVALVRVESGRSERPQMLSTVALALVVLLRGVKWRTNETCSF